jgi:hypothetical protein
MHEDPRLRNLPPRAEAVAARHEVEDLALSNLKGFLIFLALLIGASFIVVYLVMRILIHQAALEDAVQLPFPAATDIHLPPEPRIQPSRGHNTLDWQDLAAFKADEDKKLGKDSWAWVGEDKHAARVPIDVAMDMLLRQGLPTRQGPPTDGPADLPVSGGAGGLMVAPANPLTVPAGNVNSGNHP